eukprot:gene9239-9404_t
MFSNKKRQEKQQQLVVDRNAKKRQARQQHRHQQKWTNQSLGYPAAACGCPEDDLNSIRCESVGDISTSCPAAYDTTNNLAKVKTWLKGMVACSGKKINAWAAATRTRVQTRTTSHSSCESPSSRRVWLEWEGSAAQDSGICFDAAIIFTSSWTGQGKLPNAALPTIYESMGSSFSNPLSGRQSSASTDPQADEAAGNAAEHLEEGYTSDTSGDHSMVAAEGRVMWAAEGLPREQQPAQSQPLLQEEARSGQVGLKIASEQIAMPNDGCVTVNISAKAGGASKSSAVLLCPASLTDLGLPAAHHDDHLGNHHAAVSTVLSHPTEGKAALLAALGASSTRSLGAGSSGKVRLAYLRVPACLGPVPPTVAVVESSHFLMPVVVKTMQHLVACAHDGTLSFDSQDVDRELHYAQLATGSRHLPALLGCIREECRSHLVFECISQHTLNLAKWLRTLDHQKVESLSRDVILSIARTTAAACEHLHQQAVLHNDIKPENIIIKLEKHGAAVSPTGHTAIAGSYVVDLGGCVMEGASLQTLGHLTGTVEFQHPQLLEHAQDLACCYLRCHEYASLGFVILYMLVMGRQGQYMQLRQLVHDAFDNHRKGSECQCSGKLRDLRQALLQLPGDGPVGSDGCQQRVSDGLVDLVTSLLGPPEDQPSNYLELQQLLQCAAEY